MGDRMLAERNDDATDDYYSRRERRNARDIDKLIALVISLFSWRATDKAASSQDRSSPRRVVAQPK